MSCPPPVVSTCGTCPTCCALTVSKRTVERIPVCLEWAHRLDCGQPWTLKSVRHTVKQKSGASLAEPAYELSQAYASGATVAVGSQVYVATAAALPGQAPWLAGTPWALQPGAKSDLYVALDTDRRPIEMVSAPRHQSTALVEGGVHDTEYRVEALATFRNCEGHEIHLWDCALVQVKDCR